MAIGLVIGLLMGFGAGFGVGGGMDDDRTTTTGRQPPGDRATDDVPPTSEDALPQECVATMRSAQQTLALVDQALRDLRALNLAEVDRAAREVERLRGGLGEEVRQCLEKMGE